MENDTTKDFQIVITGKTIDDGNGCMIDTDGINYDLTNLTLPIDKEEDKEATLKEVVSKITIYALAKNIIDNNQNIEEKIKDFQFNIEICIGEREKENENNQE